MNHYPIHAPQAPILDYNGIDGLLSSYAVKAQYGEDRGVIKAEYKFH